VLQSTNEFRKKYASHHDHIKEKRLEEFKIYVSFHSIYRVLVFEVCAFLLFCDIKFGQGEINLNKQKYERVFFFVEEINIRMSIKLQW
jgi:hypothetical protein